MKSNFLEMGILSRWILIAFLINEAFCFQVMGAKSATNSPISLPVSKRANLHMNGGERGLRILKQKSGIKQAEDLTKKVEKKRVNPVPRDRFLSYSDKDVKNAAITVTSVGSLAVMVLLYLVKLESKFGKAGSMMSIGYFSIVATVGMFGSSGILFKLPSLKTEQVDPMVLQLYSAIGMAAVSIPLLLVLVATSNFQVAPLALIGAVIARVTGVFSYLAIQKIGYAMAPAIWAGIGMLTSFAWGTIGFREPISNLFAALSAVTLLSSGVIGIATSQTAPPAKKNNGFSLQKRSKQLKETVIGGGLIWCIVAGLLDGSSMVPFKIHETTATSTNSLFNTLNYLCTLSFGSLLTTPLLFAVYCLLKKEVPKFNFKYASFPGVVTGIMWGPGQILALHAIKYLGIAVGFPLTQTCICVTALWGIFFFKEIDISNARFMKKFSISTAAILGGAAFLSRCK